MRVNYIEDLVSRTGARLSTMQRKDKSARADLRGNGKPEGERRGPLVDY
jgi:hypothetical protein